MSTKGLSASVERHLRDYFAAHEDTLPATGLYDRILQEIERPLLSIALAECRGNQLSNCRFYRPGIGQHLQRGLYLGADIGDEFAL